MIRILAVGKLSKEFRASEQEYAKRFPVEIIEIKESTPAKEAEQLLAKIKPNDHVIALDKTGRQYSSEQFSQLLTQEKLCLVIGGSDGLDQTVLKRANLIVSFSALTFPHQLFRVMLLEQIYRGYSILQKKPYHK